MRTIFGTAADGRQVQALRLAAGEVSATVLTRGAVLQDLRLAGVGHGLTPGSDRLHDYEGRMAYFGAIVGPVANRLRGPGVVIDGTAFALPPNEASGAVLHGGKTGLHAWHWTVTDHTADALTLTADLPDGHGGLPGARRITARYTLHPPATLRLTLTATTDAPTLMNPAQHSYWNLDGTPHWRGHRLRIAADRWLPVDADLLPTGPILPLGGTPLDLRHGPALLPGAPALDTNFCLSDTGQPLREVAWLTGARGLSMAIATTAPGLQVHDGRGAVPGHGPYAGLALEPQHWPDAPANPAFPSILLRPGQPWEQVSEWRFARP